MLKGKTRKRFIRLWEISNKVPFPASGSHSTTVQGLASYVEDMRIFTPAFSKTMFMLLLEGFDEDENFISPDTMLDALNEWIDRRSKVAWELPAIEFSTVLREIRQMQEEIIG